MIFGKFVRASFGKSYGFLKVFVVYPKRRKKNQNKELEIAIKGDAKEEYATIKQVMDILQEQKINNFSLVTGLRGKNF